jgi:hypothetical protein
VGPGTIDRLFPTFAPWGRGVLAGIGPLCRAFAKAIRRAADRFSLRALRFSLRALMILVVVIGGVLGWFVRHAHFQRVAVAAVRESGGTAWYDWQRKDTSRIPRLLSFLPAPDRTRGRMLQAEMSFLARQYTTPSTAETSWLTPFVRFDYLSNVVQVSLGPKGSDAELAAIGNLGRLEILNTS